MFRTVRIVIFLGLLSFLNESLASAERSFEAEVLEEIRMTLFRVEQVLEKFEKPRIHSDYWSEFISDEEIRELDDASFYHPRNPEKIGYVLAEIIAKRKTERVQISRSLLQAVADLVYGSGFWNSAYLKALESENALTVVSAVHDCLNWGTQTTFYFLIDSLFEETLTSELRRRNVSGPQFLDSLENFRISLKEKEESLLWLRSKEKQLTPDSESRIPGDTQIEFRGGDYVIFKRVFQEEVIAEVTLRFSSENVVSEFHIEIRPEYRRSGLSYLLGREIQRRYPHVKKVETYLGLKNFEVIFEESRGGKSSDELRHSILNSPAGKLARFLGFKLVRYTLRQDSNDIRVVFLKVSNLELCDENFY